MFTRIDGNKYVGQTFGDMTVLSLKRSDSINDNRKRRIRPVMRLLVRCNVCGKEREVNPTKLVCEGKGQKHGKACNNDEHRYDALVNTTIDDMKILSVYYEDLKWKAHCECIVCGNKKDIRVDHLLAHTGTSHAACIHLNKGKAESTVPTDMGEVFRAFKFCYDKCSTLNCYQTSKGIRVPLNMLNSSFNMFIPPEAARALCELPNEWNLSISFDEEKKFFYVTKTK